MPLNYQNLVGQRNSYENQIQEEEDMVEFEMDIKEEAEQDALEADDFFNEPFLTIRNEQGKDVPYKPNALQEPNISLPGLTTFTSIPVAHDDEDNDFDIINVDDNNPQPEGSH
mmetsp:Transcript_16005/g.11538  ORF Transcript_16005/g.11538 Transcript_16005/m.11538 type:complete len:113 (-) Transcript_16005:358-696(-)|eukprot:CAMPEP_0202972042 /NCGR_PEP_ID=MMETSP1396-20130829/32862_1 /ASSEMBLY_ACC=CAM_ASM_000872 /TAXON_ID= /ORGANISM="Pseudokeronopsis sp., Strain Brazil" /LENGTH=112 /DNA_ID=CAMNT_0049702043 /DNA_START=1338 /DNA_END=1676 /DNA_ORIENTATION=+